MEAVDCTFSSYPLRRLWEKGTAHSHCCGDGPRFSTTYLPASLGLQTRIHPFDHPSTKQGLGRPSSPSDRPRSLHVPVDSCDIFHLDPRRRAWRCHNHHHQQQHYQASDIARDVNQYRPDRHPPPSRQARTNIVTEPASEAGVFGTGSTVSPKDVLCRRHVAG